MVKEKRQLKRPWLACLLNLLFLGLGYLYNGKKRLVGSILFIVSILYFIEGFIPTPESLTLLVAGLDYSILNSSDLYLLGIKGIFGYSIILIYIALGYDAYKEAQDINKSK